MFINLATQRIVLDLFQNDHELLLAIIFGTILGLISKFILDKNFIFKKKYETSKKVINSFRTYVFFGVFTTSIFWCFELAFWIIFDHQIARELGAIIGLSIGYLVKYKLDEAITFKDNNEN